MNKIKVNPSTKKIILPYDTYLKNITQPQTTLTNKTVKFYIPFEQSIDNVYTNYYNGNQPIIISQSEKSNFILRTYFFTPGTNYYPVITKATSWSTHGVKNPTFPSNIIPPEPVSVSSKIENGTSNWLSLYFNNSSVIIPYRHTLIAGGWFYVGKPQGRFNFHLTYFGMNTGNYSLYNNTSFLPQGWYFLIWFITNMDSAQRTQVCSIARFETSWYSDWTDNSILQYLVNPFMYVIDKVIDTNRVNGVYHIDLANINNNQLFKFSDDKFIITMIQKDPSQPVTINVTKNGNTSQFTFSGNDIYQAILTLQDVGMFETSYDTTITFNNVMYYRYIIGNDDNTYVTIYPKQQSNVLVTPKGIQPVIKSQINNVNDFSVMDYHKYHDVKKIQDFTPPNGASPTYMEKNGRIKKERKQGDTRESYMRIKQDDISNLRLGNFYNISFDWNSNFGFGNYVIVPPSDKHVFLVFRYTKINKHKQYYTRLEIRNATTVSSLPNYRQYLAVNFTNKFNAELNNGIMNSIISYMGVYGTFFWYPVYKFSFYISKTQYEYWYGIMGYNSNRMISRFQYYYGVGSVLNWPHSGLLNIVYQKNITSYDINTYTLTFNHYSPIIYTRTPTDLTIYMPQVYSSFFVTNTKIETNSSNVIKKSNKIIFQTQRTPSLQKQTFTRNSTQYDDWGYEQSINTPRFKDSQILLEEGTENLIETQGGASQDWSKWNHYTDTSYWSNVSQTDDTLWGKVFQGTNVNSTTALLYDYYPYSVSANTNYTFSVYLKLASGSWTGTARFVMRTSSAEIISTSKSITITSDWQRFTFTVKPTSAYSGVGIALELQSFPTNTVLYAAYPQLEAKAYDTSFAKGTRDYEKLAVPFDGTKVTPTEGTVAVKFYYPTGGFTGRIDDKTILFLGDRSITNAQRMHLWWNSASSTLNLNVANDGGTLTHIFSQPLTLTTGWHTAVFKWKKNGEYYTVNLAVDGTVIASTTSLSATNFPTSWGANVVNLLQGGDTYWSNNTYVDYVAVWARQLTDTEIAQATINPLVVQNGLYLFYDFDDNLYGFDFTKQFQKQQDKQLKLYLL